MTYNTLISAASLNQHLNDSSWVIIDCRFSLSDSAAGAKAYRMGHIANAHYAHLDKNLSSSIKSYTGRHPLPDFRLLSKKLGHWGISNHSQVVIYDDASGAFAGRLWWLLRCLGHEKVAVLDGGLMHWHRLGMSLTTVLPRLKSKTFRPYLNTACFVNATEVANGLATQRIKLIDARAAERFQGIVEPIDPVAGHIPHAINRAFQLNLNDDGLFLSASQLRQQFNHLIGSTPAEQTVHMCGSGVTACHNLLAMEHAGLAGSKLYAGSWSEWITNSNRSVCADGAA